MKGAVPTKVRAQWTGLLPDHGVERWQKLLGVSERWFPHAYDRKSLTPIRSEVKGFQMQELTCLSQVIALLLLNDWEPCLCSRILRSEDFYARAQWLVLMSTSAKLWLEDWFTINSFFTSASDIWAGMVIGKSCLAVGHLQASLSRMNSQFGRWLRRPQSEKECLEVMQFETARWTPCGLSWSCPPKPYSIIMIPSFRDAPL